MTIYQRTRTALPLLDTDVEHADPMSNAAHVMAIATPDPEPIIGIGYACDFAAEQEYGAGDLHKVFDRTLAPELRARMGRRPSGEARIDQSELVTIHDDLVAISTARRWGGLSDSTLDRAREDIASREAWCQGRTPRWCYERETVPKLRSMLRAKGVTVPPRARKSTLVDLMSDQDAASEPFRHAAWFSTGEHLIMRRDETVFGVALDALVEAAQANALLVNGISGNPFRAGVTFTDARDLGPLTLDDLARDQRFHDENMDLLAPVRAELESKGHRFHFLGNPSLISTRNDRERKVRYWLNAPRFYGWFTLEELRAEKFVTVDEGR